MVSLSCADVNRRRIRRSKPARLKCSDDRLSCEFVSSDLCQSGSDLTGFTRNFFWNGCDVRRLQRIALRDAISRPAGFLSDLLLWSKESAGREGAGDGEKDESSFH